MVLKSVVTLKDPIYMIYNFLRISRMHPQWEYMWIIRPVTNCTACQRSPRKVYIDIHKWSIMVLGHVKKYFVDIQRFS